MSEENQDIDQLTPNRGRTWADVFVNASLIFGGLFFLIIMAIAAYFILGEIPTWFGIALLSSLIFIPFLQERAKDGADLLLIADEPMKLTEYRIGRKVGLEIEGHGVQFQSKSGIYRTLLTSIDVESKTAIGSQFAELTQIDQARDMNTLQKMIDTLQSHLKESRVSAQTVGIEVEKQSIEIVDWALKTIYGAIIPTEINEAFGLKEEEKPLDVPQGFESGEVELE